MGKSHLLEEVRSAVAEHGSMPVVVRGTAGGREIPLGAFASIVAGMGALPDGLSPVMALIRHLSGARRRTCLLVDNVDRLDAASLFVVTHCARDARLPVVMTVRELDLLPEAVRELYDEGVVEVTELAPLAADEIVALGEALLDGVLTPRAAGILVEHSDGNPLYARELVAGSRHSRALEASSHGWDFATPPQATARLAQLVGTAFEGLDASLTDLAGVIAVADGMPADALEPEQVRALMRRGLVAEADGVVRLSHPLYDEALLARTPPPALDAHRARAFDLLTDQGSPIDEAARARWVDLGLAAGKAVPAHAVVAEARRAQRLMEHDRAWRLATHVLDSAPENADALALAGAAASARADLEVAENLLQRAIEASSDDESRGTAARSLAHHYAVRRHEPLRGASVLMEELAAAHDPMVRTRLEHDLLQWQMVGGALGQMPPAMEDSGDAAYTHHLAVTLMVSLIMGPLTQAESTSRTLDAVMPRHQDEVPTGAAIARLGRFMLIAYSGDIVAARQMALRFLRPDDASPEMRGAWEYSLGMIELLSGSATRTLELARDAVTHLRWRDPLGLLPAALALSEAAHTACGDVAGASSFARQIPEPMLADPKVAMLRAWAAAWSERAAGRRGIAATILVEAAHGLLAVKHVFLAGMLAHCATRAGHPERALPVLEAAAAEAGGVVDLFVAHARALADKDAEGLAVHLDTCAALGMMAGAVDAMAWQAATARRRGDVMAARRWEWRAQQSLDEHPGMALWLHDAQEGELLSARERQVALLAAERLSSREIAQQLGITPKTVANQLGAVYRKLGVSGRAELREVLGSGASE